MSSYKTDLPIDDDRLLWPPGEVARMLGIDQVCPKPAETVLRMVRRGDLEGRRVAGRILVVPESVRAWVAAEKKLRPRRRTR